MTVFSRSREQAGFTIVELLIVIVVIGILAAITIVAYNGVQNRAQETAIQNDLKTNANKILQFQITNGTMPTLAQIQNGSVDLVASKPNYATTTQSNGRNFGICIVTSPGVEKFGLFARARSGNWYSYSSTYGLRQETTSYNNNIAINCTGIGVSSSETGMYSYWGAENGQPNGWYS